MPSRYTFTAQDDALILEAILGKEGEKRGDYWLDWYQVKARIDETSRKRGLDTRDSSPDKWSRRYLWFLVLTADADGDFPYDRCMVYQLPWSKAEFAELAARIPKSIPGGLSSDPRFLKNGQPDWKEIALDMTANSEDVDRFFSVTICRKAYAVRIYFGWVRAWRSGQTPDPSSLGAPSPPAAAPVEDWLDDYALGKSEEYWRGRMDQFVAHHPSQLDELSEHLQVPEELQDKEFENDLLDEEDPYWTGVDDERAFRDSE